MIIAILLLSLAYIISVIIILRGYYKDIAELEYRILELEKRISELQKEFKHEDEMFTNYCETVNWLEINQRYAFEKLKLNESEVENMPCGKGKRKTSKGGGRKK